MNETNAVNTNQPAAVDTSTLSDTEVRLQTLEVEKAKLTEERDNYKIGMLKAKGKLPDGEEDDEAKFRRIAKETLDDSRLLEIAREQDELLKTALKENRELKLAQLNKTGTPPAAVGTHSEGPAVVDTLVTNEQMEVFKQKGWTDIDIARYKKNLQRNTR